MSAQIHQEIGTGDEKKDHWIFTLRRILHECGAGPDSARWRTVLVILAYVSSTFSNSITVAEILGNYRYGLMLSAFWFAMSVDFITMNMLYQNADAVEQTAFRRLESHPESIETLKEIATGNIAFCVMWMVLLQAMYWGFVHDECERRGLPEPGIWFYFATIFGTTIAMSFHMATSIFSWDFVGATMATEQDDFIKKIEAHELSFDEAIVIHRSQHQRHRSAISTCNAYVDISQIVFVFTNAVALYDYFVMAHSSWIHVTWYILGTLSSCVMMPLNWAAVNKNQDRLEVIVAESVAWKVTLNRSASKYDESVASESDAVTEVEKGAYVKEQQKDESTGELWNAHQRTQFLVYLRATSEKACGFGWEFGKGYSMEFLFLHLSAAFVMWQITALSNFAGFSFDKTLE